MILSTKIKITGTYKGDSKFPFWSGLKEGDVVEVSTPLKKIRRHSYGSYAPGINFKNLSDGTTFNTTMSMAANYLKKIEYDEHI